MATPAVTNKSVHNAKPAKSSRAPLTPTIGEPDALGGGQGASRNKRMRLRAAWMYFVEEMTQSEIAEHLGIGRITVNRLLSDLRERNEIKFSFGSGVPECVALERELEKLFGFKEAVVAPLSDPSSNAAVSIAAAAGQYISALLQPGMRIYRLRWNTCTALDDSLLQHLNESLAPAVTD